ncbi:MAG: hypothetical protein KDD64_03995 [Bdellovibrionales bacterium]|nr:hypothetical protein [Bdellovibrionales bacterium]
MDQITANKLLWWSRVNAGLFGFIALLLLVGGLMYGPKISTTLDNANTTMEAAKPAIEKMPMLADDVGQLTEVTTELVGIAREPLNAAADSAVDTIRNMDTDELGRAATEGTKNTARDVLDSGKRALDRVLHNPSQDGESNDQ